MTLRHYTTFAGLLIFVSGSIYACGGDDESSGNGTGGSGGANADAATGGTSNSGGSSNTGGVSGTGGASGSGTGATSGSGGIAGSGGTGGLGGAGDASTGGSGGSSGSGGCRTRNDCQGAGLLCNAETGQCVECTVTADCGPSEECTNGTCTALPQCVTSLDCAGATDGRTICDETLGVCVQCLIDADCDMGETCASQVCVPVCDSDNDCTPLGLLCDADAGHCVECLDSSACPEAEHCTDQQCVPDLCVASVEVCDGEFLRECNADGSGFARSVSCSPDTCVETTSGASCAPGGDAGAPAGCTDGEMNGSETDVDCGGPECPPCATDEACGTGSDCQSGVCDRDCFGFPIQVCSPYTCRAATCNDGIQNDGETDIDCGGTCDGCLGGRDCTVDGDCLSGDCQSGTCSGPACLAEACPFCIGQFEQPCCTATDTCGCFIQGITMCQ